MFRLGPPGGEAPRPLPKDWRRLWWSAGISAVAALVAAAFLAALDGCLIGDYEACKAEAKQALAQDRELAHEYYARARSDAPSLFPPWFEEAKFLVGGKREADREEDAKLLWTYAACNPGTAQSATAERSATDWGLQRPTKSSDCSGGGR